ncbi:PTS sugar transporter subunit IIC [Eubacteriales bacterium OttesenSCG-928-N14]|nr:PTS sugar transporter subunit IIC [Eubacteriales bacterium OttesenSCG-928-N14]
MSISFLQAFLLSLLYWIVGTPYLTAFMWNLNWPVVNGFFIGLIMGDPVTGTILGGTLQTLNMAPSMVGNTVTMDMKMAAFITIPMAMSGSLSPETIIAFAVPFTVIGAFIQPVTRTLNQIGINIADKAAAQGNTRLFCFAAWHVGPIIMFPFYFGVMFLALYFGQNAMQALLDIIPEWLMVSFMTLSKFLPGIGFAMFLKSVNRTDKLPLFFLGFYIFYYFANAGITLIGITIFGVIIALLMSQGGNKEEQGGEANE